MNQRRLANYSDLRTGTTLYSATGRVKATVHQINELFVNLKVGRLKREVSIRAAHWAACLWYLDKRCKN